MDALDLLCQGARETIKSGYYDAPPTLGNKAPPFSSALTSRPRAVIAEVKPSSPATGAMRPPEQSIRLAETFARRGARALSILTEPTRFGGSLSTLAHASGLDVPVLMKDFVLSERQLAAARACGASAVLLIETAVLRGHADYPMADFVSRAHAHKLEALVEVVSAAEFRLAQQAGADVIGINNRDLRTMEVDLRRTARVLSAVAKDRPVVGLSGVESRADADALFESGCDAILVGGGLMRASDPGAKLEELL